MSSVSNNNTDPVEKIPSGRGTRRTKGTKSSDIPLMSLEEAYTPRKARERKTVERYEPDLETSEQKKPAFHEGTGTPLKDIPRVASKLKSRKNKDYVLYTLHRFLFGRPEGKPNVKGDLESFRGFTFQNLEEEDVYWNKLEKWTVETCKSICDVLDLPFPNNKNDLHSFIMDFLKSPEPRNTSDIQEESSLQISPFSYFVRQKRGELIQSNPDKSLEDIQKELVSLWDLLPNEEKAVYQSHNPNETPTKKRKYTRRADKKPTATGEQASPARRGRKPKSAYEALTSTQKKRGAKSEEMVDDSDEEDQAEMTTAKPLVEDKEDDAEVEKTPDNDATEDVDSDSSSHKKPEHSD